MASPRVMAPASSANADLAHQPSLYRAAHPAELAGGEGRSSRGSLNMEELLRHFYADSPAGAAALAAEISSDPGEPGGEEDGEGEEEDAGVEGRTAVEGAWKGFSGDRGVDGGGDGVQGGRAWGVTLEAFLAREGVAAVEDVGAAPGEVQQVDGRMLGFVVDPAFGDGFVQQQQLLQVDGSRARSGSRVEGGKKRALQGPVDKASQQKQKRMIKNRESAARSRERKQAYTADLEKVVTKLEEEKARLVREQWTDRVSKLQEEQRKARFKQLMENLIPVDEKKRPPRRFRRTCSLDW